MSVLDNTPNLALPLPHPENDPAGVDVQRLRDALSIVDAVIFAIQGTLAAKVTQAEIDAAVARIVGSAPATLDALNELASALGNDPNFATTTATQLGLKATKTELTAAVVALTELIGGKLSNAAKTVGEANLTDDAVSRRVLADDFFATNTEVDNLATAAPLNVGQGRRLVDAAPGSVKIGDVILSKRKTIPGYLRMDGAKYLKTAYPELATHLVAPYPFDRQPASATGLQSLVGGPIVGARFGDVGVIGEVGGLTLYNFATGALANFTSTALGVNTNYSCGGMAVGPDGLLYVFWTYSTTNLVRSFNLSTLTMVDANVVHNIGTEPVYGATWLNGFWYINRGNGFWRGTTLNTLATVSSGISQCTDIIHVSGNLLFATAYNPGTPLYRSTNNGATWSTVALPLPINPSTGTLEPNWGYPTGTRLRPGGQLYLWKGKIYLRLRGGTSTNGAQDFGYIYRLNTAAPVSSELIHAQRYLNNSGGFFEFSDGLVVLNNGQPLALRIDENDKLSDGLAYVRGVIPATANNSTLDNFAIGNGTDQGGVIHPLFGSIMRTGTVLARSAASHNKDTEFRTPNIVDPAIDLPYFVRAA